jgi:pimeloyl-ACP methyl ester carboxylesterase
VKNLRKYGKKPYKVAVIHGGPGAPGYMAAVARELAKGMGVLEPLQTRATLEGQIEELAGVLKKYADLPAILIGHSWGAWLGYCVAARHPELVKKLIIVGSGPFEEKYAGGIDGERLTRLSEEERVEFLALADAVNNGATRDKDKALARIGELAAKADTYAPLPPEKEPEPLPVSEEINRRVWAEAKELRVNGELLKMGKKIKCPVVAIHGDYDPHPAGGVKLSLSRVIKDFKFILLQKCGHYPWLERYARDEFYKILKNELK